MSFILIHPDICRHKTSRNIWIFLEHGLVFTCRVYTPRYGLFRHGNDEERDVTE